MSKKRKKLKKRLERIIALNAEFKYALQSGMDRIEVLEEALRDIVNRATEVGTGKP